MSRVAILVAAQFMLGILFWVVAPVASAADQHVFDAAHSLSGGTKPFNGPCGVTTDDYGDIFVANGATEKVSEGVIDVFDSSGKFITEIPNEHTPCSIAVDSSGRLFVLEKGSSNLVRYDPLVYEPAAGEIEYGATPSPVLTSPPGGVSIAGMGMDPSNGHLYVSDGGSESKIGFRVLLADGSLDPSNPPFSENAFIDAASLTVWGQTHDVYAAGSQFKPYEPFTGRVFVMDATTHEVKLVLPDDSDAPAIDFGYTFGRGGLAIDQSNGDIYVDAVDHKTIQQFDNAGNHVGEIKFSQLRVAFPYNGIAVDQGEHSPNKGYVYVTSGDKGSNSSLFAFAPRDLGPPDVRNAHVENVGEGEALLAAELNPRGAATSYRFEYGAADCASGPCQSVPVPEAQAGAGGFFQPVKVPLTGLAAGTTYHFRLVATNHCNGLDPEEECVTKGPDATFTTFAAAGQLSCPNAALRSGASAALEDCRGYELVTPPDTNGRVPTGAVFGSNGYNAAPVLLASADGESVVFGVEGGILPGSPGGGYFDTYRSTRDSQGWHTQFSGLTGAEAQELAPGGVSADHAYSLWQVAAQKGSLPAGQYLRGPDGTIEDVGIGSQGTSSGLAYWVSPGAAHLIFAASEPLEANSPPSKTRAVYDRAPGGPTTVVSLLPGGGTPAGGESADYLGASAQGSAVVFHLGGAIYVRINNAATLKVTDDPASFGGVAADGSRVFYAKGGNIFAFDTQSEATAAVGSGGESTMVNVSADGSRVFFVSPLALSGAGANSEGASAIPGKENIYAWDVATPASVRFVATVEEEDVIGEEPPLGGSSGRRGGLGLWVSDAATPAQLRNLGVANDPSRTSADGALFAFESRAKLTGYDNSGKSEIYLYESPSGSLSCISCNPTNAPAVSDARLESRYAPFPFSIPPVNAVSQINNITAGGGSVFFQSADRLAAADVDSKVDVYEWQAQGAKHCEREAGCIRLISGGHSTADDYLYGASEDGKSVFFLSNDTLVARDADSTPSIYVAREGGGEAAAPVPQPECSGEACQPSVVAPTAPAPSSATFVGPGNRAKHPAKKRSCPKGASKSSGKHGKARCSGHHAKHRRGGRAAQTGRGAPR